MGRVNNPTTPAPPSSSPMKHFSHPHDLHPIPPHSTQNFNINICSGCKLQSSGILYGCIPCNFFIHQSCAKLPKLITHPSHGGCNLNLLTVASYPGGIFSCDACNLRGDGWSYHCSRCDFDLHVSCSVKPLKIKHHAHSCELKLTFENPYINSNGFSCDICKKMGSKQWLYRCNSCEFDVHLGCTASPPVLQHHRSLPTSLTSSHHHNQLMHSASNGAIPNPNYGFNQFQGPVNTGPFNGFMPANQPAMVHNPSIGNMQYNQPAMVHNPSIGNMQYNQPARGGGLGSNLLMSALEGVVEGAFQQVGQTIMQEVISGGDNGGGAGSSY